jgi:RHS repeat-associated protein
MHGQLTAPENRECDLASQESTGALITSAMVKVCVKESCVSAKQATRPPRPDDAPADDPQAGNAPKLPTPPPKPKTGGFLLNSLTTNESTEDSPPPKTTGVTFYTYRYYDPLTGRWPSRDPIGEGFWVDNPSFKTNVSLYQFMTNNGTNAIDFLGLLEMHYDKTQTNCLGFAMTGGNNNVLIFPIDRNNPKHKKKSLKNLIESAGWKCELKTGLENCDCACDEDKMIVAAWLNKNEDNRGKNPYTDASFDWANPEDQNLTDLHAMLAEKGCSDDYRHRSGKRPAGTKETEATKTDKKMFTGQNLCCCRDKKFGAR